ncbi:MAG: ankyrin repeat domain-containing protein [Gemmataceae bacterium]|nr:ankyrin repeat domain-containing protein [Gemmataceae bacterium]
MDAIYAEYDRIMRILANGSREDLEALSREIASFPHGVADFIGDHWITNAIGSGSKESILWMLDKQVDLAIRDTGYTVLHCAIERDRDDRLEVLEALLVAGAPVNAHGINDYTPAHLAANLEDIEALKILIRHGAELTERTTIDDYATPLEEAENLGRMKSVEFLKGINPG